MPATTKKRQEVTGTLSSGGSERDKRHAGNSNTKWRLLLPGGAMLVVGIVFGALNVLLGMAAKFPEEMRSQEKFCRLTAFVFYRQTASALILCVAYVAINKRIERPKSNKDLFLIILQGILGVYVQQFFYYLGLHQTSPNLASIFTPLSPVLVLVMALVARMEVVTWKKITGIIFAVGGAFIMAGLGIFSSTSSTAIGIVLLLINVVGGSSYLLVMKPLYGKYSVLAVTCWQYLVGAFCMAVTSSYCHAHPSAFKHPGKHGAITWWVLAYAIVFASVLNYFLISWSNKYLDSSVIALLGLIQPATTILFSLIIVGTAIKSYEIGGFFTTAIGLALIYWDQVQIALEKEKQTTMEDNNEPDESSHLIINS